jgi:predicted transcriptional regulator
VKARLESSKKAVQPSAEMNEFLMSRKPRKETKKAMLQKGLKLGPREHSRILLDIVANLGEPSAEEVSKAADLDIQTVRTSLRSLVRSGKLKRSAAGAYRVIGSMVGKAPGSRITEPARG